MTISIKETFRKSWELTKQHFQFLALLLLATLIGEAVTGHSGILSFILHLLVGSAVALAITRTTLDIVDGKKPSVDAITAEFKHFPTYLFAYFIFQIALIVGFFLLIIPGIYVAISYNWFAYLINEKHYDAMESLKQSALLVEGARWELLRFFLAVIGLNILGALALLVGLIVTIPVSMIAGALVYRMLVARKAVPTPVDAPSVPPAEVVSEAATETSSSKEGEVEAK